MCQAEFEVGRQPAPSARSASPGEVSPSLWLELRLVVLVAIIIVAVSCLPYQIGYLLTPPDRVFGGFVLDEIDSNTYLALMQQGARGQWTATLLYSPEDHPAIVVYEFYLALGHLAACLHLPLILVYHMARVLCGVLLLVGLYLFLALFIASKRGRWIAFMLAAIGSGVGWLVVVVAGSVAPGGVSPIDFWLMEAYVFFTLLLFPHSALALGLLMGLLGGLAVYFTASLCLRAWLAALICGLLLALLNPYLLVLSGIILASYWLSLWLVRRCLPWREAAMLAAPATLFALALALYVLQFNSHPVWRSFLDQDIVPSPPVWYYMTGYGIILVLALPGAWHVVHRRDERQILLMVWPAVALVASYAPLSGQRRMVFGAIIPLAALAAIGLQEIILPAIERSRLAAWLDARGYRPARLARMLILLVVALASLSNLVLLAGGVVSATTGQASIAQPLAVEEAVAWLGEHSLPDAIILSSFRVGNIIPARIGRRVVWGHWDETAFYDQKKDDITAFFSIATSDTERRAILSRYAVDYVLYGPAEQKLGDFQPGTAAYLQPVFRADQVIVFRVVDAAL